MKPTDADLRRLDVAVFARGQGTLARSLAVRMFGRLIESAHADSPPGADEVVDAVFSGGTEAARGGMMRPWLQLTADCGLALVCQRCLQPVRVDLRVDRRFVFVPGEDHAAALDAELDDDVLALEPQLDAIALLEDELVLALPLVPMHDVCPEPLVAQLDPGADTKPDADADPAHPFAALAALKRGPGPDVE